MIHRTPLQYAKCLGYLGDASKIRARVADWYGRAPSLQDCERIIAARKREFERAKQLANHDEPTPKLISERAKLQREASKRYRARQREAERLYRAELKAAEKLIRAKAQEAKHAD